MENYDQEIIEIIEKTIKYSYDVLKEDDGLIHRRSIQKKLIEANFHYDPTYLYKVFDSVDETRDGILTLEEFTNFYHIINQKGDCVKQNKQNNILNDIDFTDIAIGFVIVGITTAGALYFANKFKN